MVRVSLKKTTRLCGFIFVFIAAWSAAIAQIDRQKLPNETETSSQRQDVASEWMKTRLFAWNLPLGVQASNQIVSKDIIYKYNCDPPPSREDAEACEQRRAAQAAEAQLSLSVWGLFGAALATVFSGWAALAARAAAKAATAAVHEAQRANSIAENTAKRQLRAYLSIAGAKVSDDDKVITLTIRNSGNTPARNVMSHVNWQWYPSQQEMPSDFNFPNYVSEKKGRSKTFIGSNAETTWAHPIDPSKIQELSAGKIALYIYGSCTYEDVFATEQSITFCYKCVLGDGRYFALHATERYNDCS
jgi:hypothetical protein